MRVVWLTDIHLDHASKKARSRLFDEIKDADPECIIVTGDTGEAPNFGRFLKEVQQVKSSCDLFFVLGNHDYYGTSGVPACRANASCLADTNNFLTYLTLSGPQELTNKTTLIGVDGWGDARNGDWLKSKFYLADFMYIPELNTTHRMARVNVLNKLGDEDATLLKQQLNNVHLGTELLLVATHVPPFKESAWHLGAPSEDYALPYFSCKVTGDVLLEYADKHPNIQIQVLCGHTHSWGVYQPRDNLKVWTGKATYKHPEVQMVLEV